MAFLFTVCHVGAEAALKAEIQRDHPDLRFAYSRPGFLTFKIDQEIDPAIELGSVFARAWGVSLGKVSAKDGDERTRARAVLEVARGLKPATGKFVLHAFERDQHAHGEEPKGYVRGEWARAMEAALRAEAGEIFAVDSVATTGDFVFDLVAVGADEWWYGVHRHTEGPRSPDPGGRPALALPADAPSRAWLKLEEGIRWSGAPLKSGDTAVELGSSPGGACYALLQRGLKVIGVDPAPMAPAVVNFKGGKFKHLAQGAMTIQKEDLPEAVQWLLLDMNVGPNFTLPAVRHVVQPIRESLLGVLLTLKLGDWELASEIPVMFEKLRVMGFQEVRGTQLASSGQEIFVFGRTRKGLQERK